MPALTEWLAAKYPFESQPAAFQCTVLSDGLRCVLGATGRETAMLAQKRAQNELIGANDGEQNLFHGL